MSIAEFSTALDTPRSEGRADNGRAGDRTPPQDLLAEQSVLGAMLMSKDAIADVVEVLRGADFYRPAHELVYDAVLDLYGRGEPADAVTVAAELTKRGQLSRVGGAPYLHDLLASVSIAANAGHYADIVRQKAILRRLVDASIRIGQLSYAAEGEVDDIVDRAQAEVYAVTERRTSEDYKALSELVQPTMDEIEAIGSRGGQLAGVPTGFADLDELTNGLHPGQMVIVAARPGQGKALAVDTPLPTPTGWTTMGEVRVGDQLIGADGRPTRVLAATEVMTDRPTFEVTFSDGTQVIADGEHEWPASSRAARRAAAQRGNPRSYVDDEVMQRTTDAAATATSSYVTFGGQLLDAVGTKLGSTLHAVRRQEVDELAVIGAPNSRTRDPYREDLIVQALNGRVRKTVCWPTRAQRSRSVTTAEMAANVRLGDGRCNWAVETCAPLAGEERELLLPAYVLGAWLGDGHTAAARSTSADPQIPAMIAAECHDDEGTVRARLRTLGVLGTKHIPMTYLRASVAQRRSLLAGLLDTGGWVAGDGGVHLCLTNRRLTADAYELIVSLGYRCAWQTKRLHRRSAETSVDYRLTFSSTDDVFWLNRKRAEHRAKRTTDSVRSRSRDITSIRPVGNAPVRCVQVDNTDRLYLASKSMIPTHNSTLGLDLSRAASIRQGLTSAIFSLEMSQTEIVMRLLSAEAGIPLSHIRNGKMTDDDWQRMAKKMGEVAEAPLFIDDSPNLTMMEIRAKARRLRQRHDLKLIVVDYLQLMTSGKRVESRQVEVSEFSRQLKLLAKELDLPVVALAQLNRGPETRGGDKKPLLSDLRESGCLTANTRVLRADTGAEITIGELMNSGARDVPVWSLDEHLRLVPRTMTHAFPSGTKEVFRLRLTSGRQVEATANHPFLTYQGWQPLAALAPGTRLAVPRTTPSPLGTKPHDSDDIKFAAEHGIISDWVFSLPLAQVRMFIRHLWATDGSVRWDAAAGQGRIYYASTSRQLVDGLAALLLRCGILVRITSVAERGYRPCHHLIIDGAEQQWRFCTEIGVAGARAARAADVARRLSTVAANPNADTVPVEVRGKVEQVIGQRSITDRECASAMGTTGLGNSRMPKHAPGRPLNNLFCCDEHLDQRPPSRQRLARIADVLHDEGLHLEASNDVFFDVVASIESIGEQSTYDATVSGTHNFVANGIAVHNSLEQDADMVVLLNRPDVYDKESDRAGEADFDVAKHRNGPTRTITVAFQGHYSRFIDMHQ